MRKATLYLLILFVAFVLSGCGGSSDTAPSGQGIFRSTYSGGSSGDILIEVVGTNVTASLNDTSGSYSGSGTTDSVGNFSATLTKGSTTLTMVGVVTGTGSSATVSGTITGGLSFSFSGTYFGPSGTNPFASTYTGTFSGGDSGTFSVTVSTGGVISGTATDGTYTYTINGNVNDVGAGSFNGNASGGGFSVTFSGHFMIGTGAGRNMSGTWSSSAPATGTFTGTNGA